MESEFTCTVRWESARPLRDTNHYVVSVTGLPTPRQEPEELRQFASLAKKPDTSVHAARVDLREGSTAGILYGFSKSDLVLSGTDEVEFSARVRSLIVIAQFLLKEMRCRQELAV